MANPWFRMYSEFATDPKVQMLSEVNQRRLTMLFCLRCNDHVTLQDEEVTFLLRISNDEWQVTKDIFIERGFTNENNEILNWDKRQFTSDTSKNRVAAYRERKKQSSNSDVTLQKQKSNAIDTEQNRTDTEQNNTQTSITENITSIEPTLAASVCLSMKDRGILDINPSHQTLQALLNAGATKDEFIQAAIQSKQSGKGFSYALGIVKKQREEAAKLILHQGVMPNSNYQQSISVASRSVFKPEYIAEQTQITIEVPNESIKQIA